MKRLIVFLIRRRLKLKKYERFQFTNQNDKTVWYYFESERIVKSYLNGYAVSSSVSLNWLLDDLCEIKRWRE